MMSFVLWLRTHWTPQNLLWTIWEWLEISVDNPFKSAMAMRMKLTKIVQKYIRKRIQDYFRVPLSPVQLPKSKVIQFWFMFTRHWSIQVNYGINLNCWRILHLLIILILLSQLEQLLQKINKTLRTKLSLQLLKVILWVNLPSNWMLCKLFSLLYFMQGFVVCSPFH